MPPLCLNHRCLLARYPCAAKKGLAVRPTKVVKRACAPVEDAACNPAINQFYKKKAIRFMIIYDFL